MKVEKMVGNGCSAQSHSAQAKVPLGLVSLAAVDESRLSALSPGSTALLFMAKD